MTLVFILADPVFPSPTPLYCFHCNWYIPYNNIYYHAWYALGYAGLELLYTSKSWKMCVHCNNVVPKTRSKVVNMSAPLDHTFTTHTQSIIKHVFSVCEIWKTTNTQSSEILFSDVQTLTRPFTIKITYIFIIKHMLTYEISSVTYIVLVIDSE